MNDEIRVRKDGRPLVTKFPVTAMDRIERFDGPLPEGGIYCKMECLPDEDDMWMDEGA